MAKAYNVELKFKGKTKEKKPSKRLREAIDSVRRGETIKYESFEAFKKDMMS